MPETLCIPREPSRLLAACYELAEILSSAVLVIAILFSFAVRFAGVVGYSMLPTLVQDDWLAITAHLPEPQRGSIVIISPRTNRLYEPLVKRVIAVAGDEIDIRDGQVWVNGEALDEPYLTVNPLTLPAHEHLSNIEYPAIVPDNAVFVLGDNRGGSTDSRHEEIGFVRTDDILGRVIFRLWPAPQAIR